MQILKSWLSQLGGALVFYTVLPLPQRWPLQFEKIARWATWIGGLIGALLMLCNELLLQLPISDFFRAVLVTALWVGVTGGLHLDGVMDAADGLAVLDPERRLEVMRDSRTGAFGAMAAILLILLKVGALSDLSSALWTVPIWGRWAQWLAIVQYPYLRDEGKGAFHRHHLQMPQDLWPSVFLCFILASTALVYPHQPLSGLHLIQHLALGCLFAWGTGAWFNWRFGGMTGDLYGAVVEWTEVLVLCSLSLLKNF